LSEVNGKEHRIGNHNTDEIWLN